jgi:hypothetical protein
MASNARAGRTTGWLLLAQLATGLVVPYVLLRPLTGAPAGFLEIAAGMGGVLRLNVLVLFVGGALSVAIAIGAWHAIHARSHVFALWVLTLAVANFTLQIVENTHWLSMLSVSEAYAQAPSADVVPLRSVAVAVRAAWKWAHYSHIFVVVAWLFTLHAALWRCALVPRGLAIGGMIAAVLQVIGITLPVFGGYRMPFPEIFGLPLGLMILTVALWLIARGFVGGDEPQSVLGATSGSTSDAR